MKRKDIWEGILHGNQNVTQESTYYQVKTRRDLSLESRQGIAIPFEYADKLSPVLCDNACLEC